MISLLKGMHVYILYVLDIFLIFISFVWVFEQMFIYLMHASAHGEQKRMSGPP